VLSFGIVTEEQQYAVVAQGDIHLMRELQTVLRRRGLTSHMMAPPEDCGSGST
jgi:hypothetical protein